MENFSDRLRHIIETRRLTQVELAEKLKISDQAVANCLKNRNKPSYDFILGLVEAFPEINITWLITGKGSYTNGGENQPNVRDKDTLEELVSIQRELIAMYKREIETGRNVAAGM